MLSRLGFILYALSWILAAPMLALMLFGWQAGFMDGAGQFASGFIALVILLIGRALYFLLSAR